MALSPYLQLLLKRKPAYATADSALTLPTDGPTISQPSGTPMTRAVGIDGFGPQHDQENPIIRLGRRVGRDVRDIPYDFRDEPEEAGYRLRERTKSYFPLRTKWNYRDGDYANEPLGSQQPQSQIQPDYQPGGDIAPTVNLPQLGPRDADSARLQGAETSVRNYDNGMHPDPKTGEWVPYKRNRGLEILEGIGNTVASGFGINLPSILHPRGTDEQRARRALKDEQGIESFNLSARGAESEIAGRESNMRRDDAYADHLKAIEDATNIRLNKRDDKEVGGRVLRPRADGSGYDVIYEPPDKPIKEGAGFSLSPGEARYDSEGKLIMQREPKPDKGDGDGPDTAAYGELEQGFRTNAANARSAAEQAEAQAKKYVSEHPATATYDPNKDPNTSAMLAEAKRQRAYAADQLKRADAVAVEKVKVGAKSRGKGAAKAGGQRWSKSRWAAANQGGDVGAAVKEAQRRGMQVVE